MTSLISIESIDPLDAEKAKNQTEQDHSKLDEEVLKQIKKKLREKFEKAELPIGFINSIPPETRKLMEHFAEVTKMTDAIQRSLESGKGTFGSNDDSKRSEFNLSGGNYAIAEDMKMGNSRETGQQFFDTVAGFIPLDYDIKTQLPSIFSALGTDFSAAEAESKRAQSLLKQAPTETSALVPPAVDSLQPDTQIQQQSLQQFQNQTQTQIGTSLGQNHSHPASWDGAGIGQSRHSMQGQSSIGKPNSMSISGEKNLNMSSKISNVNTTEASLLSIRDRPDTVRAKIDLKSTGSKTEDQDQSREAVQSLPQRVQINENQPSVRQDTATSASTAQQHVEMMNAMLAEQKKSGPEGIKYNLDSWGGAQSIQITGTSQKGYKLQGSDAQVQQILVQHADGSLPISLDSDGLLGDLKVADAKSREKSEKRDA